MYPLAELHHLLSHVTSALSRQADEILHTHLGVGLSQVRILLYLQIHPNVKQKEIAEALGQTEASISRQIGIMHRQGLLRSRISPNNRRQRITTPTAKGLRAVERAKQLIQEDQSAIFESLSSRQYDELFETINLLHQNACGPGRSGACTLHKR